ncbi:MAG: Uma2 family endonuclease [Veillonellaceae bacterium]|nr:Uma2 family endonuclease [Veillonellaceae bacterium]MDD6126767.1 Uma2 family endonuclease [Veillonellaceae bacterium]
MENAAFFDEEQIPMELINGKIVMMSPRPRVNHTRVAGTIYRIFSAALKGKRCEAFPDGVDLYLDEKNHFIPDAMIICDPSQVKGDRIDGAPSLVVEVLSPSTELRDRGVKMRAYAAAGVEEYWLVDVVSKRVEVYRQQDGRLEIQRVYTYYSPEEQKENAEKPGRFRLSDEDMEQEIQVELCGGFRVPLGDVFERVGN